MTRKTTTTIGEQLGLVTVQVFRDTISFCPFLRALSILLFGLAFCLKVWLQVLTKKGQCTLYIAFSGRQSMEEIVSVRGSICFLKFSSLVQYHRGPPHVYGHWSSALHYHDDSPSLGSFPVEILCSIFRIFYWLHQIAKPTPNYAQWFSHNEPINWRDCLNLDAKKKSEESRPSFERRATTFTLTAHKEKIVCYALRV